MPRRARELFVAATAALASPDPPCVHINPLDDYIFGEFANAGRPAYARPGHAARADGVRVEPARPYLEAIPQRAVWHLERRGESQFDASQIEGLYCQMTELMPAFEQFDAEHVEEARGLVERLRARLAPLERKHMYVFYDNGDTWQSLEAEASECADEAMRRELISLAADLAIATEAYDEALRLASRIDDPKRRDRLVDAAWSRRISETLGQNNLEDAVSLARQIPVREHRMRELVSICEHASQRGRGLEIMPMLDELEAYVLACGKDISPDRARLHLELVSIWSRLDKARAFEVAERAARSVTTCVRTPQVPTERPTIWGEATVYDPLSNFEGKLMPDTLASDDYLRALRIALAYDDAALAIAAQLKVVRSGLPRVSSASATQAMEARP